MLLCCATACMHEEFPQVTPLHSSGGNPTDLSTNTHVCTTIIITPKCSVISLQSALHWAAKHGRADIVKLLAGTHGIDVNGRSVRCGRFILVDCF